MKKLVLIGMCCFVTLGLKSQNYNSDKRILTNFIIRMYNNAPFEGVRIVNDYDNAYLISVLFLDKTKYRTEAVLNRIASVKAMAEATRFLNGSTISQEMIIHTKEKADGSSDSEWIETIRILPEKTECKCISTSNKLIQRKEEITCAEDSV